MRFTFLQRVRLAICKYLGHKPDFSAGYTTRGALWCKRCGMSTDSKIGRL